MEGTEKPIVVIPAYEPPKEFVVYATEVAKSAKRLIVVNDGSGPEYDPVFEKIKRIENADCIEYGQNHGKGYALKRAFAFCAEHFDGQDIVVTADCDGQHAIEDVRKVYGAANSHKDSVILGSRNFDLPGVPKRSRLGNTNIRAIFSFFYGVKLYDTQTGLRGFTVATAKEFTKVKGDRFEYEMGMLIHAKKKGIGILETSIRTIYPENPADHVSHFKTFSDSCRMLGVVLKNLNYYALSSLLSAALDVFLFWLIANVAFTSLSAGHTWIATLVARVGSSVLNFLLNYKYVFQGASKRSIFRYYVLWTCQLGLSYGIAFLFGNVIGWNITLCKAIGDLFLAICGYRVQSHWVFARKKENGFYGGWARFARFGARLFSKRYRADVLPPDGAVVYVCRHLNMHGPYTLVKWLPFDTHIMALHPFFEEKACYRQFAEYTFADRRGKKRKKFNIAAYVSSRVVPKVVRSLKAVPVYRKSGEALKTFRKATDYLSQGESLTVFPDVEYTAGSDTPSAIYEGFLSLGEQYYKRTGKALKFIPVRIDDELRIIEEGAPVYAMNYKKDKKAAAEQLQKAIQK